MAISFGINTADLGAISSSWTSSYSGSTYDTFSDGSRVTTYADGSIYARLASGTNMSIKADGTGYVAKSDYSEYIFVNSDGSASRKYEDGSSVRLSADGSISGSGGEYAYWTMNAEGEITAAYSSSWKRVDLDEPPIDLNQFFDDVIVSDSSPIARPEYLGAKEEPVEEEIAAAPVVESTVEEEVEEASVEEEVSYPLTETLKDGATKTTQEDSSYEIKHVDGSTEKGDGEGNSTRTYEDGSYSKKFSDKSTEVKDSEGNVTTTKSDGNYTTNYADGSKETGDGDGNSTRTYEDGSYAKTYEDDSKETGDGEGNSTRTYEDGTYTKKFSDKTVEIKDSEGNITTTKADGSYTKQYADGSNEAGDGQGNSTRTFDDGSYIRNYDDESVETGETDGTYTRSFKDGSAEIKNADGSITEGTNLLDERTSNDIYTQTWEDGTVKTSSYGSYQIYHADGSETSGYKSSFSDYETYTRTWDDGTYEKLRSDDSIEKKNTEGDVTRTYEDGTYKTTYADGTKETGDNNDGSYTKQFDWRNYESRDAEGNITLGDSYSGSYTKTAPDGSYEKVQQDSKYYTDRDDFTEKGSADGSYERTYPYDNKVEKVNADGSYETTFPDGTTETGYINGEYSRTHSDGSVETGVKSEGEIVSFNRKYEDGREEFQNADGLKGTNYADGTYSHKDADGNHFYRLETSDGQGFIEKNAQGETILTYNDGSKRIEQADGSVKKVYADGQPDYEVIQNEDGSVTNVYYSNDNDPSRKECYENGWYTTKMENPDGSVTETWGLSSDLNEKPFKSVTTKTEADGTVTTATEYLREYRISALDGTAPEGKETDGLVYRAGDKVFEAEYPDGTQAGWDSIGGSYKTNPDGSFYTRDNLGYQGSDRMNDADGNTISLDSSGGLHIHYNRETAGDRSDGETFDEYLSSAGSAMLTHEYEEGDEQGVMMGSDINSSPGIDDGMPEGVEGDIAVTRRDGYEIENPEVGVTYVRQIDGSGLIFADTYQEDGSLVRQTFPATRSEDADSMTVCMDKLLEASQSSDAETREKAGEVLQIFNDSTAAWINAPILQTYSAGEQPDFSDYGPVNTTTFSADDPRDFITEYHNGQVKSVENNTGETGNEWDYVATTEMNGETYTNFSNLPAAFGGQDDDRSAIEWKDGKGNSVDASKEGDVMDVDWTKADGSEGSYTKYGQCDVVAEPRTNDEFVQDASALREFVDDTEEDIYDLISDRFETIPTDSMEGGYENDTFFNEEGATWGDDSLAADDTAVGNEPPAGDPLDEGFPPGEGDDEMDDMASALTADRSGSAAGESDSDQLADQSAEDEQEEKGNEDPVIA